MLLGFKKAQIKLLHFHPFLYSGSRSDSKKLNPNSFLKRVGLRDKSRKVILSPIVGDF